MLFSKNSLCLSDALCVMQPLKVAHHLRFSLQKTPISSGDGFIGLDHESVHDRTYICICHFTRGDILQRESWSATWKEWCYPRATQSPDWCMLACLASVDSLSDLTTQTRSQIILARNYVSLLRVSPRIKF